MIQLLVNAAGLFIGLIWVLIVVAFVVLCRDIVQFIFGEGNKP